MPRNEQHGDGRDFAARQSSCKELAQRKLKRCKSWPSALQPWLPLRRESQLGDTANTRMGTGLHPQSPSKTGKVRCDVPLESPAESFRREMEDLLEGFPRETRDRLPPAHRRAIQGTVGEAAGGAGAGGGSATVYNPKPTSLMDAIVYGLTMGVSTPSKAMPPQSVDSPVVSTSLSSPRSHSRARPAVQFDKKLFHW